MTKPLPCVRFGLINKECHSNTQKIKFDYFTLRCKTSCKGGGLAVWQTVAVASALDLRPMHTGL